MLDDQGRSEPVAVREVGLGRYQAKIDAKETARWTLRLHDQSHDKTKVLHFHRPYPAEYQLSQQMPPAVAALRQAEAASVATDLEMPSRRRSIADWLLMAAIASMLGSVLLRRV